MIGKWNKSVILTYFGLSISILGIMLLISGIDIKYTIICFMYAGVCDLFDGTIARRCKRTDEEKAFGIELDSLVDVISFIALPLVILAYINKSLYYLPIYLFYAIFAIARLAYFNITTETDKRIKYYIGLPVTYSALIFSISFLLFYVLQENIFIIVYNIIAIIVGSLYILKIKIHKPNTITSILFLLLAFVMTFIYLFIV